MSQTPSNLVARDPPTPRPPEAGELCVVALIGPDTFVGWVEGARVDAVMDGLERRFRKKEADRASVEAHASLRHLVGAKLRSADEARDFGDWVASACVWLGLRHPTHGKALRDGVDWLLPRGCVLTCSIADDPRAVRDTAWGFMVGDRIHDARPAMAGEPAHSVRMLGEDELRAARTDWKPPADPRRPPSEWTPPEHAREAART